MQPTTVTSIVLVLFACGVIGFALRNLFGAWEPVVRRPRPFSDDDIDAAVVQMRREIELYERDRRQDP